MNHTLRTRLGASVAALMVLGVLAPATLVPAALAHSSSCTLTTTYGGFQECVFSCQPGDHITISISPQQHDSAIGGTATCGGATATCSAPGGSSCTAVSSTPASFHDDAGSCNNSGPLGLYAETIQTCGTTRPPPFDAGDADGDGVPNAAELLLCGSALSRQAIQDTSADVGHRCATTYDYVPGSGVSIYVPLGGAFVGDGDGDLVPRQFEPNGVIVTVDPFGNPPVSYQPAQDEPIPIDADDGDRQVPFAWGIVDLDGDFVPDAAEPVLCLVQNDNLAEDGSCDATLQDYRPPLAIPPFPLYG